MNEITDFLKAAGKKGGRAHDGKKTRDTIRAKYGDDYYTKLAAKRKKKANK